jgi:NADH-quinone oxidoreductase subunit H
VVRESFTARFCGRGDGAAHATFRGDVEVAFASMTPGAPPLTGIVRGATLDVLPSSARASVAEARAVEGGRLLAFFGVVPGAPSARGIPVEQVRAGSLAESAGMRVGDAITAVDDVHVLSLADVIPASARAAQVTMRHPDSGLEETKTVSVVEYSGERVPTEYVPALVIVGFMIAVLLLVLMPGPPSLATIEMRIASVVRRTTKRSLLGSLVGGGRHAALSAILSAALAGLALTPYIVNRELDGLALFAVAISTLVWSRVAAEKGALGSLRMLVHATTAALAIALAIALAVAQVGAIELAEIVRVQGGMPWQFTAARHPSCVLLALVYGAALVGVLRTRPEGPTALALRVNDRPSTPAHAALLERAGVLLASALGVTVFFGGWQIPGAGPPRSSALLLLAGGLFLLKTWTMAAVLFGLRAVASRFGGRELGRLVARRLLPGLLLAAALVAASRRLVPSGALETAFGVTLVALVSLFVVRVVARVRAAVARPEPHASPFL